MPTVQHHQHKRKTLHQTLEKYPHPEKTKRFFDALVYIAGIATPLFTLPQFLQIWVNQNAGGVSVTTWSAYLIISIIFTIYGFLHKEKPIIVMYLSQAILQIFIVIGIFIYS